MHTQRCVASGKAQDHAKKRKKKKRGQKPRNTFSHAKDSVNEVNKQTNKKKPWFRQAHSHHQEQSVLSSFHYGKCFDARNTNEWLHLRRWEKSLLVSKRVKKVEEKRKRHPQTYITCSMTHGWGGDNAIVVKSTASYIPYKSHPGMSAHSNVRAVLYLTIPRQAQAENG